MLRYIRSTSRLLTSFFALAVAVTQPFALSAQVPPQTVGGPIAIDSIAVIGNVRQPDMAIILLSELSGEDTYTIYDIRKATKRLWATGQFRDITAHVEGAVGDRVVLIWEVDEQDLMRNVAITGLVNADAGQVRDTTGLRPGRPYSPALVEEAKAFIRSELAAKGIPFVNIQERVERIEGREKEVILYLDVTEGTRVTVADVVFEGNTVFSDDDLRGAMSVQAEGFFWFSSGAYDRERFDRDLQVNIPSFYTGRGYLDFRVLSDSLVIDPTTGKTRLEITVEEGPAYRLADFSISGSNEFSNEELTRLFSPERSGLFSGDGGGDELPIFNATQFDAATAQADQRYKNEGYLYSQVVPFIERNPVEEGEPPTVNVGWSIQEGPQAYVARVDIEGNEYTYERVIRDKIFVLPGDVYSQDRIIQSFQSVSSLGYFEVPMEVPSIVPNEQGDVDLTFRVTEKPTGAVNFGTSVGAGVGGLAGFVGYDQPNLFGKGKSGSLRWDFGAYQNNQTMSYSDPGIFGSLVSGSVNLFNARDRFISFRSGRRRRTGFNLRLGFLLPGARFTRLFTGYGLSRTELTLRSGEDLSLFGRPPGTQSTVSVGITRSTLNHPIFPTVGSRQTVNVDLTGGPLGGSGKFVKTTAEGSWWLPVGRMGGSADTPGSGMILALGMTMRTGVLNGDSEAFPFDRFWMGGVQFGERLRGYDETSVTPLGHFSDRSREVNDIDRLGDAFFSLTTELALRVGAQLSGALFLDAGNVWRDAREIDPTRMFRGAGVGLQVVTPFGPVGLDYAYGFDKAEPGWQFHFRLGPGL